MNVCREPGCGAVDCDVIGHGTGPQAFGHEDTDVEHMPQALEDESRRACCWPCRQRSQQNGNGSVYVRLHHVGGSELRCPTCGTHHLEHDTTTAKRMARWMDALIGLLEDESPEFSRLWQLALRRIGDQPTATRVADHEPRAFCLTHGEWKAGSSCPACLHGF